MRLLFRSARGTCHLALWRTGLKAQTELMRLQLTRRGDYAVREMLALAREPGRVQSGTGLAQSMDIPPTFVTQVMGDLVRAGLVDARTGRAGGYRLRDDPGTVSLLSVVEAVE